MEYSWSTNCQRSRYCRNRDASAAESPTGATSNLCARKKRGAAALGACVARVGRNERGGLRPRGAGRALCGAPCRPRGVGARPARSRSLWWRALAANLVPATTATDSCSVLSSRSLGSASSTEGHNSAAPRRGLTCRVEGGGVRVWRAGGVVSGGGVGWRRGGRGAKGCWVGGGGGGPICSAAGSACARPPRLR
jgi:hypothetical protein